VARLNNLVQNLLHGYNTSVIRWSRSHYISEQSYRI